MERKGQNNQGDMSVQWAAPIEGPAVWPSKVKDTQSTVNHHLMGVTERETTQREVPATRTNGLDTSGNLVEIQPEEPVRSADWSPIPHKIGDGKRREALW